MSWVPVRKRVSDDAQSLLHGGQGLEREKLEAFLCIKYGCTGELVTDVIGKLVTAGLARQKGNVLYSSRVEEREDEKDFDNP